MAVTYLIPAGLDLRTMAPAESPLTIEYSHLFLSLIVEEYGLQVDRKNLMEFVRFPVKRLRKAIPNRQLANVKALLVRLGIVEISQYAVGERCQGFRLRPPWVDRKLVPVRSIKGSAPGKRLRKVRQDRLNPLLAIHDDMIRWQKMLAIDGDAARLKMEDLRLKDEQVKAYLSTIALIENKLWFFQPDESGRCHTNLTLCPRPLREFLTLGGRPMAMIDISAAQPFIFANLYIKAGDAGENYCETNPTFSLHNHNHNQSPTQPLPSSYTPLLCIGGSVLRTLDIILWNKFYKEVKRIGRFKRIKTAKNRVVRWLNDVEQKDYWRLLRVRRTMDKLCPELVAFHDGFIQRKADYEIAWEDQRAQHKSTLSYILQREEAEWIIEGVVTRLHELYPTMPLLTLHDCVCSWPEYAEIIADMIRQVALERYGSVPHVKPST